MRQNCKEKLGGKMNRCSYCGLVLDSEGLGDIQRVRREVGMGRLVAIFLLRF
jgi:hypothetical protein